MQYDYDYVIRLLNTENLDPHSDVAITTGIDDFFS